MLQPSIFKESVEESNNGFFLESRESPFLDTFPDPLCNLNLKETSEFVKAFPMTTSISSGGKREANTTSSSSSVQHRRLLEAPPTPGRPVFSFSTTTTTVGNNLNRKSFPSKWDDAQKWLISTSCNESPSQLTKPRLQIEQKKERVSVENVSSWDDDDVSSFNAASAQVLLKDKFTDNVDQNCSNFGYSPQVPTKEGFMFKNSALLCEAMKDVGITEMVQHRDIGTEMTPLGSSTTSRCHTPFKLSSPARHNTPADRSGVLGVVSGKNSTFNINELQECHFAKLELGTQFDSVTSNWSSRAEEEEEISKSLRHFESGDGCVKSRLDSRVSAWEEEEKTKSCIRYQREEAKIQAWVNLQSAKAEAQSRKLEVKIQKMRSQLEEKLMKRMAIVHRKAEEWRIEAQQQHSQQIQKAKEQAHKMKNQHNSHNSCSCFPCNNNHHL